MPDPTLEQLQRVFDQVVKTYSHRENVTGVDVGFRYDKGKRTSDMAVRIHVREKIPEHALEADEIFPKAIEGVPIDVIQAVYTPHQEPAAVEPEEDLIDRRLRFDRLQPGISVGHQSVTAGTLGAIVFDRRTAQRGILSNWHVFAGSTAAKPGDPIVQPGPKHGGRAPQDTVARLERFLLDEHGDAAFAILNSNRDVHDVQLETGVRVTAVRHVRIGDIVSKSGRSTAVTRGLVEGIGQYTLTYAGIGSRTIGGFKIVAEEDGNPQNLEISAGGDSGALWFTAADAQGVGLHFAGETDPAPNEEHAIACHLDDVLSQLDVTLEPSGVVPPPPDEPQALVAAALAASPADLTVLLSECLVRLTRVLEAVTGSGTVASLPARKPRLARRVPAPSTRLRSPK
jgi:endonuclease G